MRDAPSIDIIQNLIKEGAKIRAFDPVAIENAKKIMPDVKYCKETYETIKDCDALVFMTEWNQFRSLNMEKIKSLMKQPIIFDLRNIYNPSKMKQYGFVYSSVGRLNGHGKK